MTRIEILLPGEQIPLDPSGSAFAHGFGVFETISVENGRLLFWEAHWRRLIRSAKHFEIPLRLDADEALNAIQELYSSSGASVQTVKLSLVSVSGGSRLFIYSRPRVSFPQEIGLLADASYSLNEHSALAGYKTHNYMENLLLMRRARSFACYDVVRLDTRGNVAEGAIANLFWVRGDAIFTPSLETGLLPGVVREVVLDAFEVETGCYGLEDVLSADCVFVTNSTVGVLSVDWLKTENRKICFDGHSTEIGNSLSRVYREKAENKGIHLGSP